MDVKTCLYCSKELTGRSDKKFCDTYCRNSYNNARYKEEFAFENDINLVLRNNKRILQTYGVDGKTRIPEQELLRKGFNFKFFTNVFASHGGSNYYFCYDYGYVKVRDTDSYVVVKWQDYME